MQPEERLARMIQGSDDPGPVRRQRDQPSPCDHWTAPVLLERAAYLRRMARAGEGAASDTVKDIPGYRATLWVRLRPGPPERHDGFTTVLFVLDGRATLLSGGVLDKPRQSPDRSHWTGSAIDGATSTEMRPGDVIHVSAGVPFQVLVANEKPFSYLLQSIRAIKEDAL